jgi:hypothetical protein
MVKTMLYLLEFAGCMPVNAVLGKKLPRGQPGVRKENTGET